MSAAGRLADLENIPQRLHDQEGGRHTARCSASSTSAHAISGTRLAAAMPPSERPTHARTPTPPTALPRYDPPFSAYRSCAQPGMHAAIRPRNRSTCPCGKRTSHRRRSSPSGSAPCRACCSSACRSAPCQQSRARRGTSSVASARSRRIARQRTASPVPRSTIHYGIQLA